MNFKFELSLSDFLAAQRLHSQRSIWSGFLYILTRWIYPIPGACFLFIAFLTARDADHQLPLTLFACGSILLLCPVYIHFQMRRLYRRTRSGPGQCDVDFDENSIHMTGAHTKSELDWNAIKRFRENKIVFLLYLAPARFIVIPKRAISEGQVAELRSLLLGKTLPTPSNREAGV